MRNFLLFIIGPALLISCISGPKSPDVSSIQVALETKRFEQDFFSMDTVHLGRSVQKLLQQYPGFTPDFIYNILGLNLDSLLAHDTEHLAAVKLFIQDYKPLKDSADILYKEFDKQTEAIKKSFQFVKYYFPGYKLPPAIITFVGPMDAFFQTSLGIQGDVLTEEGMGIGLQLHLGSNFSFYHSPMGLSLYPAYISANFDAEHITVNVARNIADDLFEDKSSGKPLIEQMVEKGKFLYLISRFLPFEKEHLLIGYSEIQLKAAKKNEGVIWSFFLNNDLLNTQEQDIIKNYIGENPKTPEFGDNAPGNLGSFAGWQIVKKYMDKFPDTSLEMMMNTEPRELYTKSKYKPRI